MRLRQLLIRAGAATELKLEGYSVERVPVLPGGGEDHVGDLAELGIERMTN